MGFGFWGLGFGFWALGFGIWVRVQGWVESLGGPARLPILLFFLVTEDGVCLLLLLLAPMSQTSISTMLAEQDFEHEHCDHVS